ncbi:ubiquitin-like domain-containing protein [Robertmurraya mangrovi]|nr:ubiquitin-like domain-containing protein [Bacillus sp. 31A1R]
MAIISASFVVFATAFGFLIYETTKNTVALNLDGKEKVVKTHAATIEELFDELSISTRSEDYLFPAGSTKVKNNLEVVWEPAKQVQIVHGNEEKKVWTTADTVEEFLKEQQISLNEHDKVQPKLEEAIKNDLNIQVEKAFEVKIVNGGKKQRVWSTSTTVADFLSQQGITLNELDRVEPKLEETINEKTVVSVIRVEKVTDVVEEPIRFAVVTKKDNTLSKGTEKTVTTGKEGLISKKYEVILENGKEKSRKLLKEKVVKEKQDKVVAVGTKVSTQTVSRGTQNVSNEFMVTATAYTPYCNGCSGRSAAGINLRSDPNLKLIAVDPSVIPLGTKVYVEGYGYAIAGDTGGSIKGNKIDVLFQTKAEAYRWGRKTVKIKILK